MMKFEHFERGYLLPDGCKDLIDAINLRAQQKAKTFLGPVEAPSMLAPTLHGELLVPELTTVAQLAALLKQKPFKIIADLMELGVFATLNQLLSFKAIYQIAHKYGYAARRSG
jgi:hypothetical protein